MKPFLITIGVLGGFLIAHIQLGGSLSLDSITSLFREKKKESQWLLDFQRVWHNASLAFYSAEDDDVHAQKIRYYTKQLVALRAELKDVELEENISFFQVSGLLGIQFVVDNVSLAEDYYSDSPELRCVFDEYKNEYIKCVQAYDQKKRSAK